MADKKQFKNRYMGFSELSSLKKSDEELQKEKEEYERFVREQNYIDSELRTQLMRNCHEKNARDGVKKHKTKAAGVKSVFILNKGELYMTSFGKGNKAEPEKHVVNDVIKTIPQTPAYKAEKAENRYKVEGRLGIKAYADDPLRSAKAPGMDLIGQKDKIEQRYFGGIFSDNIHIQLAYNIMDIEKILAVHINNVIFELNNMRREEETEYDDPIGTLRIERTWDKFINSNANQKESIKKLLDQPQLRYFGKVLYDTKLVKSIKQAKDETQKDECRKQLDEKHKQSYELLTLLSMIRQSLAHDNVYLYTFDEKYDHISAKINKRDLIEQMQVARETLKALYKERIDQLNNDFVKNSKVDINMLWSIYKADKDYSKRKQIAEDYYRFVVTKEYKNQGFSFTRLRENMILHAGANGIMDQKYDSMRGRLYRTFDFVLFKYYKEHDKECARLIEQLRAALDEDKSETDAKEKVYKEEAINVWKTVRLTIMNGVLPCMKALRIKEYKDSGINVDRRMIRDVEIDPEKASAFSMLMFLMAHFLDGKEINDLFTTLINKFDNITSFKQALEDSGSKLEMADGYAMFMESQQISEELRAINSIMRMEKKSDPDLKRTLYIEAAQVLGYPGTEEELTAYADSILNEKGEFEWRGNDFRNFIASNVIESDRFKYLVRYANVEKVSCLAKNRKIVDFVLKDVPDTQILRYYNSCEGRSEKAFRAEMRDNITNILTGFDLKSFHNVRTKVREDNTPEEMSDKKKKQAIISLYLTVLYLVVKNLVYVNSRYFMAFHCLERDTMVADGERYNDLFDNRSGDMRRFVKDCVIDDGDERPCQVNVNKRAREYIKVNYLNSDEWAVRAFRNCAEHLGAVRNADRYINDVKEFSSWFELYHYIVQRYLIDQYAYDSTTLSKKAGHEGEYIISAERVNPKTFKYFEMVKKYNTYCKDFTKALNIAFAYNLPRYKDLSINELFDRNHFLEKGKKDGKNEKLAEENE